eukprot:GHRQ01024724.1.p2 GENE.GHRQ01024724.1~~GHRQ01024724.1.p2  ORF type:complete len:191 (-),score=51.91 GHRQ01024724.1:95-667(-)
MRAIVYDPIMEGQLFKTTTAAPAEPIPSAPAAPPAGPEADGSTPGDSAEQYKSTAGSTICQPHQRRGHLSYAWKALATIAIFTISGLEHEWFLYLMLGPGEYLPGYWLAFFLVQVPLMLGEGLLLKQLKSAGIQLPKLLRIAAWQVVLTACAYTFWYPPVQVHSNMAPRAVAAVNRNVHWLLQGVQQLGR